MTPPFRPGRAGAPAPHFTARAQAILTGARAEAAALAHDHVGTEHLLLALLADDGGVAQAILDAQRVDRAALRATLGGAPMPPPSLAQHHGDPPFTTRAKQALERAVDEARRLHHTFVGGEHVLLGLLAERSGAAAQHLRETGLTLDGARLSIGRIVGAELAPSLHVASPHEHRPMAPPPLGSAPLGETQAWMRLRSALEITRLLGATPTLHREPDGTLVASLGGDLEISVTLPSDVAVRARSRTPPSTTPDA